MEGAASGLARRRRPVLWWLMSAPAVLLVVAWTSSAALASLPGNQLNQKLPISAATPRYQGDAELCEGTPPGAAVWHFVLTKTTATSATLEVTFAGLATTQHASDVRAGGTLHWYVSTTSPAILTDASTNARGNRLNLSSICDGGANVPASVEPTATFDLQTGDPTIEPTIEPTFDLETFQP